MTWINAAQSEPIGTGSPHRQQRRRVVVTALAMLLAVAAITIIGAAFVRGQLHIYRP